MGHESRIGVLLLLLVASTALGATVDVSIVSFQFSPTNLTINQGDTVRWTNNSGGTQHSTTSTTAVGGCVEGGPDPWNSLLLLPGQSFQKTFNTPGTFPYKCIPHCSGGMRGTITVLPPPANFTLSCNPATLNTAQGDSKTSTCTITSINSFSSAVTLSTSGLPAGVNSNFNPNPVTPPANNSVNSTLTVTVGGMVPPNSYPFTVKATSGSLNQIFNMTLNVSAGPDFQISCTPAAMSAIPAGSDTSVCTVSSIGGFSNQVDLDCANLPAGITCGFVPDPVTPPADGTVDSDLTVNVASNVPAAHYDFQVTGTNGATTRTFDVSLAVQDFGLSSSPSFLIAAPGGSASSTTTVLSLAGFNTPVDLSCTGLPAGASCAFTPSTVTPPADDLITSDLTVNVGAVPEGTYPFTIDGAGGGLSHTFAMSLFVTTAQDFSTSCVPTTVNGNRGGGPTTTCSVTSINSFNGPVNLSCSGLPAGVTCNFNPAQVTPPPNGISNSTLTVNIGSSVLLGSYTFQVDGTDGALNRSAPISLNVTALFVENFEDGSANGWIFQGAFWNIVAGKLIRTSDRKSSAFAPFTICTNCTVEGVLQTSGGQGNRASLIGWYVDKKNLVELMMKESENKWILKERVGGKSVAKDSFQQTIDPNTPYRATITYDGTNFLVYIDGNLILTVPAPPPAPGTIGFRIKAGKGTFDEILAY